MKKSTVAVLAWLGSALTALAQTDSIVEETVAEVEKNDGVVMGIVMVLVLILAVVAIGHMFYILFIRRKLNDELTVEDMMARRRAAGLSEESSEQEDVDAENIISEATATWATWSYPDGTDDFMPLERADVKTTAECYHRIMKIMPTDPEVIEDLNALATVTNYARKRVFTGSKTMLVVLWIVTIAFCLLAGNWQLLWLAGINTALYAASTMKPNYVLVRRELNGESDSSFLTGIIGGLFAGVAAAPVYRTVTTYSDGSKETSDDHSATFFSLAFTMIVMIILSIFLFVVSLINYLRNYVFA